MRPKGRQGTSGRISKEKESWVRVGAHDWMLFIYDEHDEDESDADMPNIVVRWRSPGKYSAQAISFTALREDELHELRTFLNRAIDMALPVAAEIDARAARAWEEGDDSYTRVYRPVPRMVIRPRRQPEHDPGVPLGPDGPGGDNARLGPGDGSGAMADGQPGDMGAKDDTAEADSFAKLGQMGRASQLFVGVSPADAGSAGAAPDPRGDIGRPEDGGNDDSA